MELGDCSWSVNSGGITVHAYYFGLALINNHLAFRRSPPGWREPWTTVVLC